MVYSFNIMLYGDNFFPKNILQKIQGNFIIEDSFHSPIDERVLPSGFKTGEMCGYGSMLLFHSLQWATEEHIIKYEQDFVEFIEQNYKLFREYEVNDIRIFIEVFYEGQCNFEIFNNKLLKRLSKYKVSLPISVYALQKREITKWEKEINREWAAQQITPRSAEAAKCMESSA